MKSIIFKKVNQPPTLGEKVLRDINEGEVIIDLKAAALNHRDVWITKGMYPGIKAGVILGSDGAGLLGEKEVVINPGMFWGNNELFPSAEFKILGMPDDGTLAEQVVVSKENVYPKPEHLCMQEAAALPLAGVTAYRALVTKGQVKAGDKVLISGVGGGVALMAFQFALAAGAEMYVTSGSYEKIERAIALGAKAGISYKEDGWHKSLVKEYGGFDLIIDSAGGKGFSNLVSILNPGGKIVIYGGSLGNIEKLSPQKIFWKQISIMGTSMGSPKDFEAMLQFVIKHQIKPHISKIFAFENGVEAFDYLDSGRQFGKVVVEV